MTSDIPKGDIQNTPPSLLQRGLLRFGVNAMVLYTMIATASFSVVITSISLIVFQGYIDFLGIGISIAAPVLILPLPARSFYSIHLRLMEIEGELRVKNEALVKSLQEIKILSGLLPICCNCKKIRDDQGYWNELESYFSVHSDLQLSHGICPECAPKLYPELYPDKIVPKNTSL